MHLYVIIIYDHIIRCISVVDIVMCTWMYLVVDRSGTLYVALFRVLNWLYKDRCCTKGSEF